MHHYANHTNALCSERAFNTPILHHRALLVNQLNTQSQYGFISRALHWIIVAAIVAQWLLAEAEEDSAPIYGSSFDTLTLHQSIGLTILLLTIIRLAWRSLNPTPAWPVDMKPYEVMLARAAHVAFYVLLLAVPMAGWALSSAEEQPLQFFNWFDWKKLTKRCSTSWWHSPCSTSSAQQSIGSPAELDAGTPPLPEPPWCRIIGNPQHVGTTMRQRS